MLKNSAFKNLLVLCLCFSALLITGCQGCRNDKEKTAEEKRKEEEERKEREKPDFEVKETVFYPGQYQEVIRNNRTKRGHWVSADFRVIANKYDAQGELSATSSTTASAVPVENTDYYSVSKRPFSIPKGEEKILSTSVYLPRRGRGLSENVSFSMSRASGGLIHPSDLHPVRLMKSFQHHMVVLTNRPDAYNYLNFIDSVTLPDEQTGVIQPPEFYFVVRTDPSKNPVPLPRYALNWTTIGYLIWDDLKVDQLDEEQQQALIDWLHYGGQLIVSGPDCLDKLTGTFLDPYLPAKFAGTKNLVAEDFEEINQHWAVKDRNQDLRRTINVDEKSPILGVKFEIHQDAAPVTNTGEIAIERQLGRGRIVVTAFSLESKPILRWPSFKSFFNGALLRRPAREFGRTNAGSLTFDWATDNTTIFDPLIGTSLRYLSRDLAAASGSDERGTPKSAAITTDEITGYNNMDMNAPISAIGYDPAQSDRFRPVHASSNEVRNLKDHRRYGGFDHDKESGTAGWNDKSGVSIAARETLKNAAGITPPNSEFVLRMLAIYLLVLVPVNWAIFRLIGRVEWAWIAAPIIAVAGAFTVAKMASLDIGFVRSNTQVACLEVFANYPRGHVSQYSALYTSLSTGYDLDLDNSSAQSLPFGDPERKWREKSLSPVTMRKTISRRLEGFQVQSNSTGLLHTEMMYDLGGAFSYRQSETDIEVLNATSLDLQQAAVIRRNADGKLQGTWIGDLPANSQSEQLEFVSIESKFEPWQGAAVLQVDPIGEYWARLSDATDVDENGAKILRLRAVRDNLPEIGGRWDEFIKIAANELAVTDAGELLDSRLTFEVFSRTMRQLFADDNVNVQKIFQVVTENLAVANGESRLVAITNQTIGANKFEPASTQTQEQTLVVVHLKRPDLEPAACDINSMEDFVSRSNLDWLEDEKSWDEDQAEDDSESEQETDSSSDASGN